MPYHHGDLRAALVDAALGALDDDGGLPSLRELARRCGVSHAAAYRHFDGVDDLRAAVGAACFRALEQALVAATSRTSTPADALQAGFRAWCAFALERPARHALMYGPLLAGLQHRDEFVSAASGAFMSLVDLLRPTGVPDPVAMAWTITGAVHGHIELIRHGRRPPGTPLDPAAQLDGVLRMALAGIAAEAGPDAPSWLRPSLDRVPGAARTRY